MLTRIDSSPFAVLVIASGEITTSYAGNGSVHESYGLDHFDGDGHSVGPKIGLANELALVVYKVQGSANEIRLQVQESDTAAFTIPVVVPIAGQEYYTITSTQTDSTYIRLPLVQIRERYFRVMAKYSGGAATTAAITVLAVRCCADRSDANAVSILGGVTGLSADVKKIDRVADEGLCYSAAITVSGGTWATNVVTFTTTGHAWIAGDYITVSGCGNANYNGNYTVVSAASNTWTAALVGDPGAFTTNGSAVQAQSTTRIVDENKAWTANQWSTMGAYVEITSGTGARQYKAVTSNGTHWIAFAAMTTAPVTSDSTYNLIEPNVNAIVCDTELNLKLGSITVTNIDAFKYRSTEPDLAAGESAQGSCDVKGNTRVAGAEAHGAAVARAPVLTGGYASDVAPTAVDVGDACRVWTSLNGSPVGAGLYQHATPANAVALALPVAKDHAIFYQTNGTALPVAGEYLATLPTYDDKDATVLQTTVNGALYTTGSSGGGTPIYGKKTVTTPGTELALATDQAVTAGFKVVVKALHTNTGVVYVGANGLTSATGHQLYPGEDCSLAVRNLNLIYLDVDVGAEGVTYIVEGA